MKFKSILTIMAITVKKEEEEGQAQGSAHHQDKADQGLTQLK